ncbi:glutathione S-transferase [Qipengyuania sp. 6B39]|uniref:glutathione S-transferase n=1 Tax=Qipengyuania proteolytica TaxID=2867239 RepID=UPI001C8A6B1A|nr:glutathione S-transferase [Qipengyuania proteolytica]MBX7496589.1 glutathione S-transferase [Qipengyuania proteolytica]
MAEPILYSFRRCPYAMRARMALQASGIACEHREVVLRDKPAAMLAASPKGTVPVLVLPDGTVLEESLDIMRWALARRDPEGWLEREDPQLLAAIDGPFKHHLDRYKYSTRYEEAQPVEHRVACLALLETLEQRLAVMPYLGGAARGFSDIASFPFIRQFANHDRDWFDAQPLPHVQAWLHGLVNSDLFAAIMRKYPRWIPAADPGNG